MGILDKLFKPEKTDSASAGLLERAGEHWQAQQAAAQAGDKNRQAKELLQVILICQQVIISGQGEGDPYVMLTGALGAAARIVTGDQRHATRLVDNYAAGIIHRWLSLLDRRQATTRGSEIGIKFYRSVMRDLRVAANCTSQEAAELMVECGAYYGGRALSWDTHREAYEEIRDTVFQALRAGEQPAPSGSEPAAVAAPLEATDPRPDHHADAAEPAESPPQSPAEERGWTVRLPLDDQARDVVRQAIVNAFISSGESDRERWSDLMVGAEARYDSVRPQVVRGRPRRVCEFSMEEAELLLEALRGAERKWHEKASSARTNGSDKSNGQNGHPRADQFDEMALGARLLLDVLTPRRATPE